MNSRLQKVSWPAVRLDEALRVLAQRTGLQLKSVDTLRPPVASVVDSSESICEWIQTAARFLGIEAEPVETSFGHVQSLLRSCGSCLLRLDETGSYFLVVIQSRLGSLRVISPELKIIRIQSRVVAATLRHTIADPLIPEVNVLLDRAAIRGRRRRAAFEAILQERLASVPLQCGWLLRVPPGQSFRDQISEVRVVRHLISFAAVHLAESLLVVGSWWIIGAAVLQGRADWGWLFGWALLLMTQIPCRMIATWTQGVIALRAGGILKRRLLAGSLRLQPEEIRHQGAGQLLGRVIESEALESLAMSGGLTGVAAIIEALTAIVVLAAGAQNFLLAFLLFAWIVLLSCLAWQYVCRRLSWTERRVEITNAMIERMVGHRTRLVQEPREQWHESEDAALIDYLESCRKMDGSLVRFVAIAPRGWLIISVLALVRNFVSGDVTSSNLAVAFGGIMLALVALRTLSESLEYCSGAAVAWKQARLLFEAAAREEILGAPEYLRLKPQEDRDPENRRVLMEARDLVFQHDGRYEKVLDGCSVTLYQNDRILLEGESGGGKSTLAAILAGLRQPQAGLLILGGLDRQTAGTRAWRRAVVTAPQFHENYLLTGTLAFNLLMGRNWPPSTGDYEEAEEICRELGLGDLLDRMPAGLLQTVGETGWQLSHGERTRVFIARALLQRAEIIILDESFGALDASSLQTAMDCVQKRARTLIVIGHP